MNTSLDDTANRDALLDEAVAAYLQAEAEGSRPDRNQWLARYQGLTAELEGFFADHDRVRRLMGPLQAIGGALRNDTFFSNEATAVHPTLANETPAPAPSGFTDYELLDRLGLGGMGVVYRARQHSLNRLVALKMIRPGELATPAEVARFRNEAELVAQLDHPGIVPVYEVGERAGQPFFTMKLIEGGNLLAHRDRFLADPRAAAALLFQVAQAVHHAHQRGVLHRDLKPGNILLDRDGRPLVTDFGLAKRLTEQNALTLSHTIVGTPSYLAPEQTSGKRAAVTTATDVYGLGAILYALLTGRPPFAGESVLDTLEQVRSLEPTPPRRLWSGVPVDLETVCLKCLAKEPARRYASAAHLAEDLGRFLEGKPVQARPAGPARRLAKWARRRPALAGLVGVTLLAVAAVVGISVHHQRQLSAALGEAQQRKEEATANYRNARDVIKQMLARARDPQQGELPRHTELRRHQQQDALGFLLKAAEQQGEEPEVIADVADARVLAAQLQQALGQPEEARANVETAIGLLTRLTERFPEESSYPTRLAYAWMTLGVRHQRKEARMASLRRALAIYEGLDAVGADVVRGLSQAHHNLANACHEQGQRGEAEGHWRRALALREGLLRAEPSSREHRLAIAQTWLNLSVLLQQQPARLGEAAAFHDRAVDGLGRLLAENPDDLDSAHELALLRVNWAYALLHTGKAEDALKGLDENVTLLRRVAEREPNLARPRDLLFRTHGMRATIFDLRGRPKEAAAEYEQVVALSPPAERDNYRAELVVLRGLAGDHARAVAEAAALAEELPSGTPWQRYYNLARVCSNAAGAASGGEADRHEAVALRLLDKARAAAPEAVWNKQHQSLGEDFQALAGREAFRRWLTGKTP